MAKEGAHQPRLHPADTQIMGGGEGGARTDPPHGQHGPREQPPPLNWRMRSVMTLAAGCRAPAWARRCPGVGDGLWPPALARRQRLLSCSDFVKQGAGFLTASYPHSLAPPPWRGQPPPIPLQHTVPPPGAPLPSFPALCTFQPCNTSALQCYPPPPVPSSCPANPHHPSLRQPGICSGPGASRDLHLLPAAPARSTPAPPQP